MADGKKRKQNVYVKIFVYILSNFDFSLPMKIEYGIIKSNIGYLCPQRGRNRFAFCLAEGARFCAAAGSPPARGPKKERNAMDLRECYAELGGDYEGVVGRFHGERLVLKFTLKFLEDGSYALLRDSLGDGRMEEAFRASHTLKGVCQNLGFTKLYESSAALTEALRACGPLPPEADGLFLQVTEDYERTAAAIRRLQNAL